MRLAEYILAGGLFVICLIGIVSAVLSIIYGGDKGKGA